MASTIRGNDNFDSANVGDTSLGAVGTYIIAKDTTETTSNYVFKAGRTQSGSNLEAFAPTTGTNPVITASSTAYTLSSWSSTNNSYGSPGQVKDDNTFSGSWRAMSPGGTNFSTSSSSWNLNFGTLWVRYS